MRRGRCWAGLTGCWLMVAAGSAPLAAQAVRGQVVDQATKAAVVQATMLLLTEERVAVAQTTTDSAGRFTIVAPRGGYRVRFERLGYRPVVTQAFQLRAGETAAYELQVGAMAAFALDTVTVEGRLVPPVKLAGFYRRRARGYGEFVAMRVLATSNRRV